MVRFQQADPEAPGALIGALSPALMRFFRSQFAIREQADDLLQETWLRIHRVRHTYRPGEPVLPWVYAVARRVGIDAYRKTRRITPVSKVAVYTYDPQGRLNFVRAVGDAGAAPCWAIVNHAGTHLYVTNTGDNSIEVYSLADPLNPAPVQHFVMDNIGGAVFSTVIDHSDNWIYVSNEQSSATAPVTSNAFHTLKVASDGSLSEPFAPTSLPVTSTQPIRVQGITVF